MKIQPRSDQYLGKRFWSAYNIDILYTIAYKDGNYYAVTYYKRKWTHRKYQRGSSYERVFTKDLLTEEQIKRNIEIGDWIKYEDRAKYIINR